MEDSVPDISIIVVNYQVKEYVGLLLHSIQKAAQNLKVEIFVIDNYSNDGSIEYLSALPYDIKIIANQANQGFAKANNQGVHRAQGKYSLLINPDTIIQENCLEVMKKYMDSHLDCAVSGYRIINPTGSFAPESKRSVPTLSSALFRVLGLDILLPQSKIFGKRYLGWLDEYETNKVPIISGAGMFWRSSVLKELQGFDEDFFMYGEDDDICFRVEKINQSVNYIPKSTILHFKGESDKEVSLKHVKKLNQGIYLFYKKHYESGQNFIIVSLVKSVFYLRVFIQYLIGLYRRKKRTNESISKIIIVSDEKDVETLFHKENITKEIIPTHNMTSSLMQESILDSKKTLGDKASIVFDVRSLSYKDIFEILTSLRSYNFDIKFLIKSQNIILGKSSVINLSL